MKVTNRVKKVTRVWKATVTTTTTTITKATTVIITITTRSYTTLPLKKVLGLAMRLVSLAIWDSKVISIVIMVITVTTTTMATTLTTKNPLKLVPRRV
jgi:uncharacterized membrane protein YkvI